MRIFPTHPATKKVNYWESNKGRPAETINTKVSGKVDLIFYKLNLLPIFLVNKSKQKKNRKTVICRIMKNFFTITETGARNANSASICKFNTKVESFNSESHCAKSFIS